ncbi:MAG: two-component system, OmpR family, phosphate regulon sensor histidine kinase PhoR [Actinomycetota bacterium]|nr:two-component system, OmpR family, phosphate regulon sensor histidine kinase PhoR [Actinomycetota bacterium]
MSTSVLLCDSAEGLAQMQYELLRKAPDLAVEVTTDPFRLVEFAARTQPPVIVTEFTLEGLGGAELVKRLRASSQASSIVGWTGLQDLDKIAEILATGVEGLVAKADGTEAALHAIRTVLDGGHSLSSTIATTVGGELGQLLRRSRRLEAEITEIREQMEQGTAAKADFLANISHELRTPVTVAKGIAYVLRNPTVPADERDEFLLQLQASLDKLMTMVDEIITIAELERGTFALNLQVTDLAPLARHAVDDVSRQYPDIKIDAHIPDSLEAVADGARIGAVVRELLDNACRYSPTERSVELHARNLEEGAMVQVVDRGNGMDRDVVTRSFDQPFSTGEATLRKEKAGVGVGLHLARQLIVEHGGILWTDPIPGGGTRVSFCIPNHPGSHMSAPPVDAA